MGEAKAFGNKTIEQKFPYSKLQKSYQKLLPFGFTFGCMHTFVSNYFYYMLIALLLINLWFQLLANSLLEGHRKTFQFNMFSKDDYEQKIPQLQEDILMLTAEKSEAARSKIIEMVEAAAELNVIWSESIVTGTFTTFCFLSI